MYQCAREFLDCNSFNAVFLGDLAGFFPPRSSDFPLILYAFNHVVEAVVLRPGNSGDKPVRGLVARCTCRQARHGDNRLDAQLASQNEGVTHGLAVCMPHRGVDQRVAGAVQCRNFHTALVQLSLESCALCIVVDELFRRRDEAAAAPAASSHFDCVDAISLNLVEHFSERDLAEYVSANRKLHNKFLHTFILCLLPGRSDRRPGRACCCVEKWYVK